MKKLFHYIAEFARLAILSFKHRHFFRSMTDVGRIFVLRLAATRPGRRFFSSKLVTVGVNGPLQEIYLRRGTSDILILHEIFEVGAYEPARKWQLSANSVVLDLGGNIGLATLYFSTVFPTANLVVVEPDSDNRCILQMNCRSLIEEGRIKLVSAFVGAKNGFAGIDRSQESWGYRKVDLAERGGEQIECLSVPSLLQRSGQTTVDLIKCDIEGSEAELFGSCREWIGMVRYLIVETHLPYSLKALYQDLRHDGWDFDIVREWQGNSISQCFLERKQSPQFLA